ncbi:hypothetical protein F6R98_15225 [Candidatus Methylospira mobilis]|uniref:Alginate export domain-containing protein n=1 Tax=Candidatus Methylospira mobilis TaxID=1808979 RepID=A0A5Q0BL06_9GAMM|nr:alginate export family protein [Candidatus Methylospira mobilis]QFY43812.1 hypothetical protein F6R98_15225 [Candidatus Methylospira mobilis]WNV04803.1 alginate export family protein [Candidatus Methylospira mobilis]
MRFKTKPLGFAITAGTALMTAQFALTSPVWATTPPSDIDATLTPAPVSEPAKAAPPATAKREAVPAEYAGQGISTAKAPKDDPKGSIAPEYFNNRPRQNLGAVESQRKDELSGKANWENKENFRLHDLFQLPEWISLSIEDRIRYEAYATPWRGGAPTKQSFVGQDALVNQLVVWNEFRFNDQWRAGYEFWDARSLVNGPYQQGYTKTGATVIQPYVDSLNSSTVNTGQFAQIYAAYIHRGLFDAVDSETKAGQMTMSVGSNRLIGRAAYRNTQQQYVGVQQRFREAKGDWELLAFANVPEILYPGSPTPQNYSSTYSTQQAMTDNVIWNRPQTNAYFTGAMFTQNKLFDGSKGELYLYYLNEGPENILNRRLFTPGFRIYKASKKGEFNYELETIGQTGTAVVKSSTANFQANLYNPTALTSASNASTSSSGYLPSQNVGGVFQHIHAGYTFDTNFDPRLTLQWDYGTSHFDTLYGPTVFEYGPTGIGGFFANRTNINSPGWKFEFIPHRDVTVYVNQRWWWLADAYSTSGWAGTNIFNSTSGKNYQGSYVGQTIELNARWDAHENVSFQAGWQVLMKGDLAISGTGAVGVGSVQTTTGGYSTSGLSGGWTNGAIQHNGSNVNLWYTQMQVRF